MKVKHNLKFGVCALLSMLCLISFATREKVLQIYKGGEVVQEFPISEIDYIEVNDIIEIPGSIEATVADNSITISWNKVEGASYNVYRSNDNVDFSLLATEIEETSYTDQNPLRGTNYYKIKAVVNGRESNFSMAVAGVLQNSELPSGIYLGIYGFSRGFQTQPIECLSEENISDYHNFINGLSATQSFTWLYYAVDKSIDYMKSMVLPEDLSEVAIVTFTDGQDIGSLDELDNEEPGKYLSNSQYRDALNNRLGSEKVSNVSISAYTIGVLADRQGSSLTTFRNNMNSLATSAKNVFEVENLENLNHAFEQIANSLSETKYVQQFQLSISGHGEGELCRFTFDNVSSYQSSQLYIEGTYRRKDKALTDIKYVGLTSSSGAEVIGSFDNESGKYDYIFKDLKADDGTLIPTTNVQHWFTDENVWQDVDDEFYFNPDDASLEKIKRSAAIMLNLDCSKSMDGQKLTTLKEAANKFVQTLADNSVDPYEVASVRLDNTELLLPLGETATLTATVLPSTAKLKTVTWSSSNPSVATVDENGCVNAHSPGTCVITVTTVDGGYKAECVVKVITLVSQIIMDNSSLDLNNGETATLKVSLYPEEADFQEVEWTSSNREVVEVDSDGNVTAKKGGQATITALTTDGTNLTATCDIFVHQEITDIAFPQSTVTLCLQDKGTLTPKLFPEDATELEVRWESSDENIVTVDDEGRIVGVSSGMADVTVFSMDGKHQASCRIEVEPAVNLGLSVPWATYNLGASNPGDYGDYYAWGEVSTKNSYLPSNYKWMIYMSETQFALTKYNSDSQYGQRDNKDSLEDNDDAAKVVKGDKWRIPNAAQWTELATKCTWKWTARDGHFGYLITSSIPGYTDRSIFLPAAGAKDSSGDQGIGTTGIYQTNETYGSIYAYVWSFSELKVVSNHTSRVAGLSVRPILVEY